MAWRAGMLMVVVVGCAVIPAGAQAGDTNGDFALSYTGTTEGFPTEPGRNEQSGYDDCSGPQRLIGIGGALIESVPAVPNHAGFALGKAFNVAIEPEDQYPGAPVPDSNHQVADSLFPGDSNVNLSEATICAENAPAISYRDKTHRVKKRSRGRVKVSCPDGKHVVSGGGRASGPFGSGRLATSAPFDSNDPGTKPDDGWRVTADNLSTKRRRVTSEAICVGGGGFSYESTAFSVNKRSRKHVEVDCPVGEFVMGGGLTHGIGFRRATIVASRFPAGFTQTWLIEVDNLSRKRAAGRAFAICHS
jgi:hypothetical protein